MYRDPELPNGFQDGDFEQRELEEAGRTSARIRKAGKCDHGWRQGGLPEGKSKCLHCGKIATDKELDEEARELRSIY
jgi:hypothetical protein